MTNTTGIDKVSDYTIVQGTHGDPEMHFAGCADLDRKRIRSDIYITSRAITQGEMAADFYSDFEMDEAEALSAIEIMPCCNRP